MARGMSVNRLAVLLAVLAGLFLMHGSPAAAASGCHRETATVMPTAAHAKAHHPGTVAESGRGHGHAGEVCLAAPTQQKQLAGPGPVPAGTIAEAAPGIGPAVGRADSTRAPPSGGRDVLLRVCVARN